MDLQKPRIIEIQVRIDCNGCVQKIKKALHGIEGISDVCIDFPQQKLTILGWADPERIVKAIRKTRKMAIICNDSEQPDPAGQPPPPQPSPPVEPDPSPPPENPQPLPPENPVVNDTDAEQHIPGPRHAQEGYVTYSYPNSYHIAPALPPEPAQAFPPSPIYVTHSYNTHRPSTYVTEYDNTMSPPKQAYYSNGNATNTRSPGPGNANDTRMFGPRNGQEAYVTYHHLPDYRYEHQNRYHNAQAFPQEPASVPRNPVYGMHGNNTYRSSPYVIEYENIESPPRQAYHSRDEQYSNEYQISGNNNANISSMFSDENPNSCKII